MQDIINVTREDHFDVPIVATRTPEVDRLASKHGGLLAQGRTRKAWKKRANADKFSGHILTCGKIAWLHRPLLPLSKVDLRDQDATQETSAVGETALKQRGFKFRILLG